MTAASSLSLPRRAPRGFRCRARQHGGTAVGFLLGMVVGLIVAAAAALLASRAPLPLINKSDQVNAMVVAPSNGQVPDPNRPLYRERRSSVQHRARLPVVVRLICCRLARSGCRPMPKPCVPG